jgi:rod shape-determining protein MreC
MARASSLIIVIVLLLSCGGGVAWFYASRGRGAVSSPESAAALVLRSPQRGLMAVGGWFSDVGRAMFGRESTLRQNETLRAQVDDLGGQNQRLRRYLRENQELRALLKMPKPTGGKTVAADVIALDFSDYTRRISINVNERQGVHAKDVVFTSQGIVGQVTAAGVGFPSQSEVLLLTDRQSSVGAVTARSMAKGIVQGTGERVCKMSYLDYSADVREGDLVLSAGDSTIFPRGLPIGRVVKVEKNKTYSTVSATIDPAVAFDRISAVYVRTVNNGKN